jgi:hypothetical protein
MYYTDLRKGERRLEIDLSRVTRVLLDRAVGTFQFVAGGQLGESVARDAVAAHQTHWRVAVRCLKT